MVFGFSNFLKILIIIIIIIIIINIIKNLALSLAYPSLTSKLLRVEL